MNTCPKCNGEGTVFDPRSLLLTVALPIAMLVERGSKEGVTKQTCPTCNGDGFTGGGLSHTPNLPRKRYKRQLTYA